MLNRDPKPEVLRLEELALQVKAGDIKLPKFQRPFVWKRPDMLLLLDSIYHGYPIGSLLLWNSSQRLKSVRDIADLVIESSVTAYPTSYLLDGQQRLTTLCGALFWIGGPPESIWNIHFDLEREEFLHGKGVDLSRCIPLNKIIDTGNFIAQCMRFQHLSDREVYIARAEKLLRSIKDYKIAVVKIGDISIEEVAPIFERINSTGRKLTMVDLMMAATWSNGFDLANEISAIRRAADEAGVSGISDQFVLRSIAAAAGFGVNKDDVQRLRSLAPKQLLECARACQEAYAKAASWISTVLPIQDASYLPYGLFLTYAVEIFRIAGQINSKQSGELEKWFWYTSSTSYFAGASTGQNSRDIESVRTFAKNLSTQLFETQPIDITHLLFDKFNLRNASSTTFALALLQQKPKYSISGKALNIEMLAEKGSRLFNRFQDEGLPEFNLCTSINPYRERCASAITDAEHLQSHLLTEQAVAYASMGEVNNFLQVRAKVAAEFIEEKTGCSVSYEVNPPLVSSANADFDDEEIVFG